jgi:hypothetical protein
MKAAHVPSVRAAPALAAVFPCVLLGVLLAACAVRGASAQDDHWLPGFGWPYAGIDGEVHASIVYGGDLIAGGKFNECGGVETGSIARWDGTSWHPLGEGIDGYVDAFCIYHGDLIAAGLFYRAGSVPANLIARWDGTDWHPLGTGLSGDPDWALSLAVYNDKLIVGGVFSRAGGVPVRNVAAWDGHAWSAMGSGLPDPGEALAVWNGTLFAGGTRFVRAWNGADWFPIAADPDLELGTLVAHGPELLAGGMFTQIGGITALHAASWDGAAWHPMGPGFDNWVGAFLDTGSELLAGGYFSSSGGKPMRALARWNGSGWSAYAGGTNGSIRTMCTHGTDLIIGGGFEEAGGVEASGLARYRGSEWSALGPPGEQGFDFYTARLASYRGDLVVTGDFSRAGRTPAAWAARWTGAGWAAMGQGLACAYVYGMAEHQGLLYAGGSIWDDGSHPGGNLICWNGSAWIPAGSGADNTVYCLAETPIGLVAGGDFETIDGVPAKHIAVHDATGWRPLGAGIHSQDPHSPDESSVRCLAWHNGELYVAGDFEMAGGVLAKNVARWNGSEWSALGDGFPENQYWSSTVWALASYNGDLYAGGEFARVGGSPGDAIARWDGASWTQPGQGANDAVETLAVFEGSLYAGGFFSEMDGASMWRIARWDGLRWSPLGQGIWWTEQPDVKCVLPYGGDLVVAGYFVRAGSTFSYNLAHWGGTASAVEISPSVPPTGGITLRLPNPYRAGDRISVLGGGAARIRAVLFDAQGRLVRTLQQDGTSPELHWDGRSGAGRSAPAGMYYLRVERGGKRTASRVVLVR